MTNSDKILKKFVFSLYILLISAGCYAQDYILVGETYSAKVSKIDPVTNTKIASVQVADSVGVPTPNVVKMVLDTVHNWAFICAHTDNAVSVIDLNTFTATYPPISITGVTRPRGLAINKTCDTLYIANEGADGIQDSTDPLSIVQIVGNTFPPTLTLVNSIPVGKQPTNVMLSHDGKYAVVSCRNEASITVVDLTGNFIIYKYVYPNTTYEPEGIDIHPTQNIMYCTTHGQNTIDLLDLDVMSITSSFPISYSGAPPQPSGGLFSPNGDIFLLSAQTSGKIYVYNTTDPYNPVLIPPVLPAGGSQPHRAVFLNDTIAYIPNTNNTQPVGSVSIVNVGVTHANIGQVSGTWYGPLSMVLVKNTTTSIQSYNTKNEKINIYPNPFSMQTTLWTANPLINATLTVYNCFGQTVKQIKNISGRTVVLNRDNLASGLYFVRLTQDNKVIAINKLVITD